MNWRVVEANLGGQGANGGLISYGTTGASWPLTGPVSKFLGTNADYDYPFCNLNQAFNAFSVPAGQADANGYPLPGISADSGYFGNQDGWAGALPTGDYKVSFEGTGQLQITRTGTMTSVGSFTGPWQQVGNEWRNVLHITQVAMTSFGTQNLNFHIQNGPGQTVTNVKIYFPGCDYDDPHLFNPHYVQALSPFRSLRFMGILAINGWSNHGNTISNWADRPLPSSSFGPPPPGGWPWEKVVELINETGKDAWINFPVRATDDYATHLGDFLRDHLDFVNIAKVRAAQGMTTPFQITVEFGNETWGYADQKTVLTNYAHADVTSPWGNHAPYDGIYTGPFTFSWGGPGTAPSDSIRIEQETADRLVHFTQILERELSSINQQSIIKPVFAGWQTGKGVYVDAGLRFIQANYGPPSNYIAYVSVSTYISPTSDSTLTSFFSSINTQIDDWFASTDSASSGATAVFHDMVAITQQYGVKMASYEGGYSPPNNVNINVDRVALNDTRITDVYTHLFANWTQTFGADAPLNAFTLEESSNIPTSNMQWAMWGSLDSSLMDLSGCTQNLRQYPDNALPNIYDPTFLSYCPRYKAMVDQAN